MQHNSMNLGQVADIYTNYAIIDERGSDYTEYYSAKSITSVKRLVLLNDLESFILSILNLTKVEFKKFNLNCLDYNVYAKIYELIKIKRINREDCDDQQVFIGQNDQHSLKKAYAKEFFNHLQDDCIDILYRYYEDKYNEGSGIEVIKFTRID